ncbi:MAG TPA: hypothetical protein VFQ91_27505 [Bryobacteraceae bacterium]|nr:hypothetical protein [Bryobacteraceae bacterium]
MSKVAKHLKFQELGPDKVVGVSGIGGLDAYAVQYARQLGVAGPVVAVARNEEKLKVAK